MVIKLNQTAFCIGMIARFRYNGKSFGHTKVNVPSNEQLYLQFVTPHPHYRKIKWDLYFYLEQLHPWPFESISHKRLTGLRFFYSNQNQNHLKLLLRSNIATYLAVKSNSIIIYPLYTAVAWQLNNNENIIKNFEMNSPI